MKPKFDDLDYPERYTSGKIETWNLYELALSDEEFRGAMKSNVIKYLLRYDKKGGVHDLQKIHRYVDRLVRFEKGKRIGWVEENV